jgi:hypothetical protein
LLLRVFNVDDKEADFVCDTIDGRVCRADVDAFRCLAIGLIVCGTGSGTFVVNDGGNGTAAGICCNVAGIADGSKVCVIGCDFAELLRRSFNRVFGFDTPFPISGTSPLTCVSRLVGVPFMLNPLIALLFPSFTCPASILILALSACNSPYGNVVNFEVAANIDNGEDGSMISCCMNTGVD